MSVFTRPKYGHMSICTLYTIWAYVNICIIHTAILHPLTGTTASLRPKAKNASEWPCCGHGSALPSTFTRPPSTTSQRSQPRHYPYTPGALLFFFSNAVNLSITRYPRCFGPPLPSGPPCVWVDQLYCTPVRSVMYARCPACLVGLSFIFIHTQTHPNTHTHTHTHRSLFYLYTHVNTHTHTHTHTHRENWTRQNAST